MKNITITKKYTDLPCGHRQWKHSGHCRFVHGHNLDIEIELSAEVEDETGFVVDFGNLKWVKELLEKQFDHTLLICVDDPQLEEFKQLARQGLCDLRIVSSTSAEATASWVLYVLNECIRDRTTTTHRNLRARSVIVKRVTVWEDSKNSATAHFRE